MCIYSIIQNIFHPHNYSTIFIIKSQATFPQITGVYNEETKYFLTKYSFALLAWSVLLVCWVLQLSVRFLLGEILKK